MSDPSSPSAETTAAVAPTPETMPAPPEAAEAAEATAETAAVTTVPFKSIRIRLVKDIHIPAPATMEQVQAAVPFLSAEAPDFEIELSESDSLGDGRFTLSAEGRVKKLPFQAKSLAELKAMKAPQNELAEIKGEVGVYLYQPGLASEGYRAMRLQLPPSAQFGVPIESAHGGIWIDTRELEAQMRLMQAQGAQQTPPQTQSPQPQQRSPQNPQRAQVPGPLRPNGFPRR